MRSLPDARAPEDAAPKVYGGADAGEADDDEADADEADAPVTVVDSDWTSDAIYDLAIVRGGAIEDVPHCKEGMPRFASRWRAVDAWGLPVGMVEGRDQHDQGSFHRYVLVSGERGVGVYVKAPHWKPRSARWNATAEERRAHARWLGQQAPATAASEVRFFQSRPPAEAAKLAVAVLPDALLVSRQTTSGGWTEITRVDCDCGPASWPHYAIRAIVDMNGDGLPEIIVHFNTTAAGEGYEIVLSSIDEARSFREIADNADTCP